MMKKILFIAFVAFTVGVISSQAQSPYSQNIVGYVTRPLPGNNAFVQINSPLVAGTNTVESVMPTIKKGDTVSFWNGLSFTALTYAGPNFDGHSHAWVDSQGNGQDSPVINPSRGFVYQNNGDAVTNVFCGYVPTTNSTTIPGHAFALLVSVIPISGAVDGPGISLPLRAGDKVFIWLGSRYQAFTYQGANFDSLGHAFIDDNGQALPSPVVQVGQAFFYQNNQDSAEIWNQGLKL